VQAQTILNRYLTSQVTRSETQERGQTHEAAGAAPSDSAGGGEHGARGLAPQPVHRFFATTQCSSDAIGLVVLRLIIGGLRDDARHAVVIDGQDLTAVAWPAPVHERPHAARTPNRRPQRPPPQAHDPPGNHIPTTPAQPADGAHKDT
jgi:hypothetical protein